MPSRAYVIPLTHGQRSVWGGCDDNTPQHSNNQQEEIFLLKALESLLLAGHAAHAGEDDGVETPHPPSLQHDTVTPHIDSRPNAFFNVIKDKIPEILAMEWIRSTMVAAVYTQAMVHVGKCGADEWRQACLALGIDFDRPPFQGKSNIDYLDTFGAMAFCISRKECDVRWDQLKQLQPGVLDMYTKMMHVREERGVTVDIEGIFTTVEREIALPTLPEPPAPPKVPPRVPRGSAVKQTCDEEQGVCRLRNI